MSLVSRRLTTWIFGLDDNGTVQSATQLVMNINKGSEPIIIKPLTCNL